MSARRFVQIAGGVLLVLFLVGWAMLSLYFSSETFQQHVESILKPALMNRGIRFDELDVSPTGQIRISNLRIRLPDGTDLVLDELRGFTEFSALVKGEAKVTFDVSRLAREYLARRRLGIDLAADSQILYVSLASSLTKLGSEKDLRGELHLKGVRMAVSPEVAGGNGFPVHFEDGTLSLIHHVLTSDGLRFTLPSMDTMGEQDLVFTFDGNIRSLFGAPEFVGGRISTEISLKPIWTRALDVIRAAEVTRKVSFSGPLALTATLEGPVLSPAIQSQFGCPDLTLRMAGDFREIDIHYFEMKGTVERLADGSAHGTVSGGKVVGEYFRFLDKEKKHLTVQADAFSSGLRYSGMVLDLLDTKFAAYGGVVVGSLRWDLGDREIRYSTNLKGDTAYAYRIAFRDIDLGSFSQDVSGLPRPLEGKLKGALEARGRTLLLRYMTGSGRIRADGFRLGTLPARDRLDGLLVAGAGAELTGLDLGGFESDLLLQRAELQIPGIDARGNDGRFQGGLVYDILTLDASGVGRLSLDPSALARFPLTASRLAAGATLDVALTGKINEPSVSYRLPDGALTGGKLELPVPRPPAPPLAGYNEVAPPDAGAGPAGAGARTGAGGTTPPGGPPGMGLPEATSPGAPAVQPRP